jgi:ribonuclease P protein component
MAALPKHNRLSGKKEFAQLFSGTRPLSGANLSLRALRAPISAPFRVAILITSKAIPLATQRNLTRRRVPAAMVVKHRVIHGRSPELDARIASVHYLFGLPPRTALRRLQHAIRQMIADETI